MSRFASLCCVLVCSIAFGDDPYPILAIAVEGDAVDGIGVIETINNLAINSNGDWLVEANTSFANTDEDTVLLKNGSVFLREGFGGLDAPAGAIINTFDSITLNDSGKGGFNFFIDPFPTSEDSGVYIDTNLVIQESDISTAAGFTPGTPFIGFFDVKINGNDRLMVIASIDDPAIPSSVDRAVMLVDAANQTIVAKEGDVLPGQTESVQDFGTGPHESAVNDNDDVLYVAELTGSTTTDQAIYLDQTLLAQEGSPSPIGGRDYEILSSRGNDLNNHGQYVFKANLIGDTADDEVIVKDGAVFKQEGDAAPGGFSLTGFGTSSGPVLISDFGDVLWFGQWDDPNTDIDSGLFLNDLLLVQEGVSMVGGLVVDTISSGSDAFSMSPDGRWILFEATLEGGINGAFAIEIPSGDTVPPDSLTVFRGLLISGTLEDAAESDDMRLRFNPGFVLNSSEAPVWLIFDAALPVDSPTDLKLVVESQAGTPGLTATTEAWNWNNGAYVVVDVSPTTFNVDSVLVLDLSARIGDYVQSGSGAVRTRIGWRKTGITINFPWEVRLDQLVWNYQ